MATEGPNNPDTVENKTGRGTIAWSAVTLGNAVSSNDSYATVMLTALAESNYILFRDFDFTAMSDDAEITEVRIDVEIKGSTTGASIKGARIWNAGAFEGDFETWGYSITTSDSVGDFSRTTIQWDVSLTGAEVKSTDFGVGITVEAGAAPLTVSVDVGTCTVTYIDSSDPGNNPPKEPPGDPPGVVMLLAASRRSVRGGHGPPVLPY